MSNNFFSHWKCLCAKEALIREQHASTKRAIIDDVCVADTLRTSKLAHCAKEAALVREQLASTKRAIIDASRAPIAELGEAVNRLYAALRVMY